MLPATGGPFDASVDQTDVRNASELGARFYRRRQQHDAEQVDTDRRCREQAVEVDRLKRLVAELLLDKRMLQDRSRKTTARRPSTASSGFQLASAIAAMVRRSE